MVAAPTLAEVRVVAGHGRAGVDSTAAVAGPCAALFSRSQSTTLSLSLSVQARLTVATSVAPGWWT